VDWQRLPDFSWHNISKRKKYTLHMTTDFTTGPKIYQGAVNFSKWPYTIRTLSIPGPSKIYPNYKIWFVNTCTIWQPWWIGKGAREKTLDSILKYFLRGHSFELLQHRVIESLSP
jgi:hypothetical protein